MEILGALAVRFARVFLLSAVGICVLLLGCQRRLIYHPRGYAPGQVAETGVGKLRYPVAGAGEQVAFLLGAHPAPETLWILCGGNGSLALNWVPFVSGLRDKTAAYVLFELPGYGLCEGSASPDDVRESMRQLKTALAAEYGITALELAERTRFLGHSIGAASALIGAEEFGTKQVVLVSPFTTMTEMARLTVGWPLCHLNLHRYDNRARLRSLAERGGTATVFHGTGDRLIPVEMSRQLAAEFPGVVSLHEVDGADHNNVVDLAGEALREAVRSKVSGSVTFETK